VIVDGAGLNKARVDRENIGKLKRYFGEVDTE
jgi:hypothetical protein